MDEIDQAQGHNEDFQAYALKQHRLRGQSSYTGTDCIECGEEIDILRRHAAPGCTRCYCCQEYFESRAVLR